MFYEATSMFDPKAEERFVELARTGLKGRTVILITHRPASFVMADRVVTLENGQIKEFHPVRVSGGV